VADHVGIQFRLVHGAFGQQFNEGGPLLDDRIHRILVIDSKAAGLETDSESLEQAHSRAGLVGLKLGR